MLAWEIARPAPAAHGPLRRTQRAEPAPGAGEVLLRVRACGVCRTDLHIAEGDLPLRTAPITPGHEIVGEVVAAGESARRFRVGERVGVAWLRGTCGSCPYCRRGAENLCSEASYTGWDAHGGYVEYTLAPETYAYALPTDWGDEAAAPLLCAGIIGYRALRRAELPPGGRLGIYGFGGSAHLAAQIAVAEGAAVHVRTRSAAARELATQLGAASVGEPHDPLPEPLDSAVLFAPAGELVPVALAALDRGGTLALAGIHVSGIPALDYQRHLFQERTLRSVTANTRADGEEFLRLADRMRLRVSSTPYPMDEADRALADLAAGRVRGAAVLVT